MLLLLGLSPATAQQDRDWNTCNQLSNLDSKLAGCSRIIERGKREPIKNRAVAYTNRCYVYNLRGDYDRAIRDADQAIRLDPRVAVFYQSRGAIMHERRDFDRAIADFSEMMRVDPKNMFAFHLRGRTYREKRDFDRAIADFNEANRLNPKHGLPLFGRGLTHEAKGDLSAAYRDVVEGLALDPGNAEGQQIRDRLRTALTGQAPAPAATPAPSKADAPVAVVSAPPVVQQLVPSPPVAAIAGPRVALVIGNGRYQHATTLPNPANDASDISAALRALGFDVVEGRDLDKRGMEDKVRQFSRKLDNAKLALFFYAGHGMQVGGRNYLVPIDARLERQGDLSFETIDVSQVLAQMEAEQRVNLVFLDACRDNPLSRSFARAMGARSTAVGQGLASIQSAVGTMIAYATQPDAVALDGTGRNSPFTTALLKHINTRGLEIGSMMRRVRAEVVQTTNGRAGALGSFVAAGRGDFGAVSLDGSCFALSVLWHQTGLRAGTIMLLIALKQTQRGHAAI